MTDGNNENKEINQTSEDGVDKLIRFLESDRGHAVANQVMAGIGKYFNKSTTHELLNRIFQVVVVLVVIFVVYKLAELEKLDASIGVLLGTLVGYMFGRKE